MTPVPPAPGDPARAGCMPGWDRGDRCLTRHTRAGEYPRGGPLYGHPSAKRCRKHVKSAMFRTGGVELPSQLA